MARKPADVVNITLRLRETLRNRLERASEKSERPLNGEIVARLEASFETEDKVALLKEEQREIRRVLEDSRTKLEQDRAELKQESQRRLAEVEKLKQDLQKYRAKHAEDLRQFQEEVKRAEEDMDQAMERTKREVAVVDALVGDDIAAKEAIRTVALLLADNPGWADTADGVHRITQGITEGVKAAANLEAKP
jgi:chromosome segregation ATPase